MSATASDMIEMLRRAYLPEGRPPGGIFAPEIGSPDGRRRADLIWLSTTTAGGDELVGHEVKVSRTDVLVELSDPTKADPWARYCDRWWLVVSDPALVEGLDIPTAWGVMAPPSGRRTRSMTVVRPAPALKPANPAPAMRRLASWMLHRHQDAENNLRASLLHRDREIERLRQEVDALRLSGGARHPQAQRIQKILTAVERQIRHEHHWGEVDDDQVIEALLDRERVRRIAETMRYELGRLLGDITRAVEPLGGVREALEKAETQRLRLEAAS